MSNFKYVNYPAIGNVLFEKSKKAKRVIISFKSPSNIRVAVPRYITLRKAESFVSQKLDWIKKQQTKYSKKVNATELTNAVSSAEKLKLINQVERLANKYGFTYGELTLRKMKTRWGSCSHHNNISLNTGLIALTDELKDYVILHELVHTKVKNHSKEFWEELGSIIHNPKSFNKELKQNYGL
ncbi:M48 family metallopeptidase [Candidatus Neomarinimicrobiota bacterium]